MIKAVLDANVIISALLNPKGSPAFILEYLRLDHFKLVVSKEILHEIERVLKYPKLVKSHRLSTNQIRKLLDFIEIISISVDLSRHKREKVVLRDLSDIIYLRTAELGEVDYLVSGDQDLLSLEKYSFIPVILPRHFLDILDKPLS